MENSGSVNVPLLEAEAAGPPSGPLGSPVNDTWPVRLRGSLKRLLPRVPDVLVLAWVTTFHQVVGIPWRFGKIFYDEHWFLNEGWSVMKGQVPYRDFQEFKPPLIFFVNALGLKLFGLEDLAYRKIFALLSLASFLALALALLSRRTHRWLVVALLMLMINHFFDEKMQRGSINNAESVAIDFFMLGIGVLLTRTKWERTQQVLGGALLALSPLSKEPMALATACAWLSLLLLHRIETERKGSARRFVLFSLGGVAGVAATWLIYLLATRSLRSYVMQLKLTFAYAANYAYQTHWVSRTPEGGPVAELFRQLNKGYLNASHLAVFIPFFVALVTLRRPSRLVGVGALATFAAALYAVSVGHGFSPNYFIMALAGTFFCVVLGGIALDTSSRQPGSDIRHWLGAAWLGVALVTSLPRFCSEWTRYGSIKAEPVPVSESDVAFVRAHTSPGDKIWTTDDPLLYVYSDRLSAFRGGIILDDIIEYYPGSTDQERFAFLREGLAKTRPRLVVLGDTMEKPKRKRRAMSELVMPFLHDNGYIKLNDRFYLRPD